MVERDFCITVFSSSGASCGGRCYEAWRLGLMDAETFHRATDIRPPRGRGFYLPQAEQLREVSSLRSSMPVARVWAQPAGAMPPLWASCTPRGFGVRNALA